METNIGNHLGIAHAALEHAIDALYSEHAAGRLSVEGQKALESIEDAFVELIPVLIVHGNAAWQSTAMDVLMFIAAPSRAPMMSEERGERLREAYRKDRRAERQMLDEKYNLEPSPIDEVWG